MQAIILAGGLGTRLREVVSDVPKPMAPINGKPFLGYLLEYLQKEGITSVVLSVHYASEIIKNYFNDDYQGLPITYAHEEKLLGTGGAIRYALSFVQNNKQPVFVLNGDTFVKLDYQAMFAAHQQSKKLLSICLRNMQESGRYGTVRINHEQHIVAFQEKAQHNGGLINAGVYLLDPALFEKFNLPRQFSFETEFLLPFVGSLEPHAFITHDYFIDIGIPADYAKANRELAPIVSSISFKTSQHWVSQVKKQKSLYLIILVTCFVLLVATIIHGTINQNSLLNFLTLIQSLKWSEALFYFSLIFILSNLLFIPLGLPLNLFAGMLWGTLWGGLIVNFLAAFIAAISFLIARVFSQHFLRHFFNHPFFKKLQYTIDSHDWQFIFAARINPIVPFNISNYLFGLIPSLSFKRYLLATIFGNLLPSFVFASMGHTLQVFSLRNTHIKTMVFEVTLVFLLVSLLLIVKMMLFQKKATFKTNLT